MDFAICITYIAFMFKFLQHTSLPKIVISHTGCSYSFRLYASLTCPNVIRDLMNHFHIFCMHDTVL